MLISDGCDCFYLDELVDVTENRHTEQRTQHIVICERIPDYLASRSEVISA